MIIPSADGANSTLAIGTPLARLFFEPQNTIVISSSFEKPRRRLVQAAKPRASPSITRTSGQHSQSHPS
jgi:hypothetical protein